MFQIGLLNKISPVGLERFDRQKYIYHADIERPDAILVRSASMHEMEFADNLLAIGRAGAGVNNIPVDRCAEQGIVVFNTPGANANAVKELVILGMLISSRKVPEALEWVQTLKGQGDEVTKLVEKGKSQFIGPEIAGKTLGVIGLGAIGVLVANAAAALGMKVLGYDPFISVDGAWNLSSEVEHVTSLNEIFQQSDYLTLHVPQTKETKGMVNESSIALMKTGARILNFARGGLVDSADICAALENGKLSAYVTDFADDTLLGVKGVIALPHLGASTPESEDNCAKMAAKELMDYLEDGNIVHSVNFPNAVMPRSGAHRVCIIHQNVPAVIAKISTRFSEDGINIENMLNQSRGNYAYTMLDTNSEISDELLAALQQAKEIIRVRVL